MSRITPPDVSEWMVQRLREEFTPAHPTLQVDVRIPDDWHGQYPLIVIRDDGGSQSQAMLFIRQIGVSVYASTADNPKPCRDLAAQVYASLTDTTLLADSTNPVCAINYDDCNGPYAASVSQSAACYYSTIGYTLFSTK